VIISATFIVRIADVDNVNFAESTEIPEEIEYKAAYSKTVTHGIIYQIKLLTWVAWQLTKDASMSDWKLAAEMCNAHGFHDLILKYADNNVVANEDSVSNTRYLYRFVQIRHKLKVCKMSARKLTSKAKYAERQFNLIYLFKFYLSLLEKFKSDQIVDLTIFTNNDIGRIEFLVPEEREDLFGFAARGKRYRINVGMFKSSKLIDMLHEVRHEDNLISDFLKKLIFAVNQPSESELEELIVRDIGKIYAFPEMYYNNLYKYMIQWFLVYKNQKAYYLTQKHIEKNLENIEKYLRDIENKHFINLFSSILNIT